MKWPRDPLVPHAEHVCCCNPEDSRQRSVNAGCTIHGLESLTMKKALYTWSRKK